MTLKWTHGKFLGCEPVVDRTTLHIPRDSKLFEIISKMDSSIPKWKGIEDRIIENDREKWAEMIFDEFVARMSVYYPEKKEMLQKLWGIVIWKVIYGEQLKEEYIEEIEKLIKQS